MALNGTTRFAFTLLLCGVLLGMASFTTFVWAAPIRTFYVAANGDDTADGSTTRPWRTLQRAAQDVQPGDLIIARPGRYVGFVLGWDGPQNGTGANPITFRGESGAIIDTRNNRTADGINLEGASFIVIEGFTIANGGTIIRAGIRSVINRGVVIRSNQVDNVGHWGILTGFSNDLLIENNVTSRSQIEHGIYVSNACINPIVRNNQVWGNAANGIHMNGDLSQGGNGLILNALVEKNVIYDNGRLGGSGINADGVQNSRFLNNLLYNNHASGISLYRIDGAAGSINNLIAHNTITMASDARWALNIQNGSTGTTVVNNILHNNHSFRGSIDISADSLPGLSSNRNVVMERFTVDDGSVQNLAQWQQQTGQDRDSVVATPAALFVDPTGNDYQLSSNSPARDTGMIRADVPEDRVGTPRPLGPTSDIGAYEFGSRTDMTPPLAPVNLRIVSN
jgi:Right handed beta helix region